MTRIVPGIAAAIVIAAAFLAPWVALARDPDGRYAQSPLRDWFKSLKQPGTNISCCDETDCHRTEFEIKGNGYRAVVNGRWVDVPPAKVISDSKNPTGSAIVCHSKYATTSDEIFCFAPGPMY